MIPILPIVTPWDQAATLDRLGGDEALLAELAQIFAQESPKQMEKLRDAVSRSDADAIMRGAHTIKGEVSCLGAVLASSTAQELERMGRDKEVAGAEEIFLNLEREVEAFRRLLMAAVSTHS